MSAITALESTDQLNLNLLDACSSGDLVRVKYCLGKKANIEFTESGMKTATPLLRAARFGHFDIVKYLLLEADPKANAHADEIIRDGIWIHADLLECAGESDNVELFTWLLENTDLELNTEQTVKRDTILVHLAKYKSVKILMFLYSNQVLGKEVWEKDKAALLCMLSSGNLSMVQFVAQEFPNILRDEEALTYAIRGGNFEAIKLVYNANKAALKKYTKYDSPLHRAVETIECDQETFGFLLNEFPEAINFKDFEASTLAHYTILPDDQFNENQKKKLKLLLTKNPNLLHMKNKYEQNLLLRALRINNEGSGIHSEIYIEAARFILQEYYPQASELIFDGKPFLHIAIEKVIQRGYFDVDNPVAFKLRNKIFNFIEYLLNHYPALMNSEYRGLKPLAFAASLITDPKYGKKVQGFVNYFLSKGYPIEAFNNDKLTKDFQALFAIGSKKPNRDELLLIKFYGNALNAASNIDNGNKLLHTAIKNGNRELALRLLEAGADPDVQNTAGKTAFDFAEDFDKENRDPFFLDILAYYKAKNLFAKWTDALDEEALKSKPSEKSMPMKEEKGKQEEKGKKEEKGKLESNLILAQIQQIAPLAFKIMNHVEFLKGFEINGLQQAIWQNLANVLAPVDNLGHPLAIEHPTLAFEVLNKFPKGHPFYKDANKRMHAVLLSEGFVLTQSKDNKQLVFKRREEAIRELSEVGNKLSNIEANEQGIETKEQGSLDEDEDTPKLNNIEELDRLTLEYKIRCLCVFDPNYDLLNYYIGEYVTTLNVKGLQHAQKGAEIRKKIFEFGIQNNPDAVMEILNLTRERNKLREMVKSLQSGSGPRAPLTLQYSSQREGLSTAVSTASGTASERPLSNRPPKIQ